MKNYDIRKIAEKFCIPGSYTGGAPYGCGHINDTYAVCFCGTDGASVRYILQRINTEIFNADELMENICLVTAFLKKKIAAEGGDPERETLTIVMTRSGMTFHKEPDGSCWRVYTFVENTETYQSVTSPDVFSNAGAAFGHFQKQLADFNAGLLHESIKDFHNTEKRYADFERSVSRASDERLKISHSEIDFVHSHKSQCGIVVSDLKSGRLPLRVTHNDTKLNNILIDSGTGRGICIIDLDTVMAGSLLYDFGDSNRFGSNTAAEDETDLSKVSFDLGLFSAYTKGFLSEARGSITPRECELLPFSCLLMTLECGIRFLADYLDGDIYFKISHPTHNLERARNQFALISDIEKKMPEMIAIVSDLRA